MIKIGHRFSFEAVNSAFFSVDSFFFLRYSVLACIQYVNHSLFVTTAVFTPKVSMVISIRGLLIFILVQH